VNKKFACELNFALSYKAYYYEASLGFNGYFQTLSTVIKSQFEEQYKVVYIKVN
jgi:hypothetical protein